MDLDVVRVVIETLEHLRLKRSLKWSFRPSFASAGAALVLVSTPLRLRRKRQTDRPTETEILTIQYRNHM
jgi:hypothetical protein